MMNDDGDHDGMMVIDVMGECNCNNEMIGGVDHTRMLLECISFHMYHCIMLHM